jgi:glyoxylase-like metal-dependent hydrolase (beta-lactamase superfamily II)
MLALAGLGILLALPRTLNAGDLSQILPGVFRYRDTCNVYAIVRNQKALLIDFGSGEILKSLPEINARQVNWILHTHFHRDQCQGDRLAKAQGVRIAVPEAERKYFETAEQLWQQKKVFDLYDLRNEFFMPRENIAVDSGLQPNTTFEWEGLKIRVIGSPGHTEGSLSYLVDLDGRRLAFCGDLAASSGKILTMHDLEWVYVGTRGIAAEIASLNMIRQYAPDVLLPSHGEPTSQVQETIPKLISELDIIYDEYNWYTYAVRQPFTGATRRSPHIWHVRTERGGTAYVILSDSGHAFMWDCDHHDIPRIAEIQKATGFKQIDFIALSHIHDDHVGGANDIRRIYGAKVWAMRHMMDVLEHPMAYNLPCLWPDPVHVDRVLEDGEKIVWEGVPLQFFYLPGQTEFTEGMLLEIDGKRLLFDGDNICMSVPGRPMLGHYGCRNYQRLDGGHIYCARKFLEVRPDYIAPNHFEWVPATEEILNSYLKNSEEMKQAFTAVLDQPDPMFGMDNNWLSFYPYQLEAKPGDVVPLQVRYRNWVFADSTVQAAFRAPEGWVFQPETVEVHAPPRSMASATVTMRIPLTAKTGYRYVITLDASRDGERLETHPESPMATALSRFGGPNARY